MGDAQDMHGGGGSISTDDMSCPWTEVSASNGHHLESVRQQKLLKTQLQRVLGTYDPSMVSMGRQIGEGGQGCIYEAKFYLPFSFKPFPMVVKKFKALEGVFHGQFPLAIGASKCSSRLCGPLGYVIKENSLCMILLKYTCDLRAHIDARMKDLRDETYGYRGPPFLEFVAQDIILQLAMSMKGFHECGIYHKDLKAANILIRRFRDINDGKWLPVVDLDIADFERSEDVNGTGFYRAPEVMKSLITRVPLSQDQWLAADIYSFGMICYEVLTGGIPFHGHALSDYDLVLNGGRPELPDHVPEQMKDIIRRCWHADPSFRPSWTDIIQVLTENPAGDADAASEALMNRRIYIENLASLESLVGSSIEANLVKMKQLIHAHMHLDASESKGFVNYVYWALEFIATAEEYVSKFDVESPPEYPLLCKWPEYMERRNLGALLCHQVLAFGWNIMPYYPFQNELVLDNSLRESATQRPEILYLMKRVYFSIALQLGHIQWAKEFDEEMSRIGKLLFCHAFIKWQLWTEVVMEERNTPPIVNSEDGVEELIFLVCFIVVALVDTYIYVLALFTYEPIVLCLQYGLYRIKGCNNFLYRSSGYRICRLQRAWMNYTRYKLLSVALILSLIYLVTNYRWKGMLGWILFPCILRSSGYWRRALVSG